jgi:hypothetical protein
MLRQQQDAHGASVDEFVQRLRRDTRIEYRIRNVPN